ncbi:GNAT family N-acetyltransferase [Frankia sp. R82]|uniref:GNAT family N-acetyltransferase n=1 Tax=Frankia sp. R82 TaxID=2950553 RepID=UPI002043675E|nr:GNAT family N-acetyltransferase [Frankia sp. R82]MCM3886768.1 GNAT family N-acetyltransferase [Frankia sp. R82]
MRPVSPLPPGYLTYRQALGTESEIAAIVALVESAYRGESSRAGWTTEADLLAGRRTDSAEVRAAVTDPNSLVLLATDPAGERVGCCHVQRRIESPAQPTATSARTGDVAQPGKRTRAGKGDRSGDAGQAWTGAVGAYFGMFAVRPGLQGAGIGGSLLARAEQHAVRTWAAQWMEMLVIAQRGELLDWYHRRGYTTTSQHRPFPYDDRRFGEPLRPDLYFVVLRRRLG